MQIRLPRRRGNFPNQKDFHMDSNKRPDDMVRITTKELADKFIEEQIALVRQQVGSRKVLLALSGGVDSSVVVYA